MAYYKVFQMIDKGILEAAGPTALGRFAHNLGYRIVSEQSSRVYEYT